MRATTIKALCAVGIGASTAVTMTAGPASAESLSGRSATYDSVAAYYDPGNYMNLCDKAPNDGDGAFLMWRRGGNPWRSTVTYNDCLRVENNIPDGQYLEFYVCDWKYYSGVGRRAVNCGFTYATNDS